MPERFPLVARLRARGVHSRTYRSYLIFYRIEDQSVVVLNVLHGARDYVSLIFPG